MLHDHEIPQGFLMALGRNTRAMARFSALTDAQKQAAINAARTVKSKRAMEELVNRL